MIRRSLSILRHQDAQGWHLDCILADGHQCGCWSIYPRLHSLSHKTSQINMQWIENKPHRRFYLDYSGPISQGRGVCEHLWRGMVVAHRGITNHAIHELKAMEFSLHLKTDGLACFQTTHRLPSWLKKVI